MAVKVIKPTKEQLEKLAERFKCFKFEKPSNEKVEEFKNRFFPKKKSE